MSEKKILLIEQKPVPRRVVHMVCTNDAFNVLADDGSVWTFNGTKLGKGEWHAFPALPDRTVEELRDG